MSKTLYHINPRTGEYGICKAKIKNCPFIHGETKEEAMKTYESYMSAELFTTLITTPKIDFSATVMSRVPLKELDSAQLSQTLRHEAKKLNFDLETIDSAMELASLLHAHQTRLGRDKYDKTPYIEHPLRNALRLIRLGVKDQNTIIATILHDTVEDGSQRFAKYSTKNNLDENQSRELLKRYIKNTYGSEVLSIVMAVTNEHIPISVSTELTPEQKRKIYFDHVTKNLKDSPKPFLTKLSDFIDNAAGLHHMKITPENETRIRRQAAKYLPLINFFVDGLDRLDLGLEKDKINSVKDQLAYAKQNLTRIISG